VSALFDTLGQRRRDRYETDLKGRPCCLIANLRSLFAASGPVWLPHHKS